MNRVGIYINDFINLFYPRICNSCGRNLIQNENLICIECLYLLPKTNYHLRKDNPVSQIFWGRIQIENACSYFFFHKGSRYQKLIHKLKYNGQKEIGFELGKHFGADLSESELYKNIDYIIPVPLHPNRQKQRGYNQSDWIAKGISLQTHSKVLVNNLYRSIETETQTRKTKFERWKNVENIFKIKNPSELEGKNVLLVDDILTTGATLESCANTLLKIKNIKVSIATLGFADT